MSQNSINENFPEFTPELTEPLRTGGLAVTLYKFQSIWEKPIRNVKQTETTSDEPAFEEGFNVYSESDNTNSR